MHLITLGESLIDLFPAEVGKRLVEVSAFLPSPGGAPANTAVAATRLGAETAFIGKVGDDLFGRHLVESLAAEGVDTRGVRFDDYARTTMAIIAMVDENTPEFMFYRNPGADTRLRPDELDADLLRSTRALHIGSLSLTDEPSRSATYEAVRIAAGAGAMISFDVNYRPRLWASPEQALAQIEAMIPLTQVVKVNEGELRLVGGSEEIEQAAREILDKGPELVIVTLGSQGSYFQTRNHTQFIPSFAVVTVDAVGCGDAFMAGMLVQLTRTPDWRSQLAPDHLAAMMRYAAAVGAITATKKGVIPALPTAAQVDQFLAARS